MSPSISKRPFDRDSVLQRAANYINRAENALELGAGTAEERGSNPPEDALEAAAALASVAGALIAYATEGGPNNPPLG